MSEYVIKTEQWQKYLLYFLMYGKQDIIKELIKIFNFTAGKDKLNEEYNLYLFNYLLENFQKSEHFLKFFKLILKTTTEFKLSTDSPKKIASFLSDVIQNALNDRCLCVYDKEQLGKKTLFTNYKFKVYSFANINLAQDEIKPPPRWSLINDEILKQNPKIKTAFKNYRSYSKTARPGNSERFLNLHKQLHQLFCPYKKRPYCPYCNVLGEGEAKYAKGCHDCKKIFQNIKELFKDKDADNIVRRIKENMRKSQKYGISQEELWHAFEKHFDKKYKECHSNDNDMLKNVKNVNTSLFEKIKNDMKQLMCIE